MRRLGSFGLLLAAAAIVSATPSCERRALVLIDVQASAAFDAEPVHLENVRLTVTANRNLTTRFPPVRLSTTRPYQIGVYLPSDMTGRVTFDATIDDGTCVWGTGSAVAPNVQGGDTTALDAPLSIEPTGSCVPVGGTGTAGAGGVTGAAGMGGMTGAAGAGGVTGAAGVTGVAGSSGVGGGVTGASGRGGVTGTAGIGGAAGAGPGIAGRGGAIGTAGSGSGGTLGTAGIGGMTGAAGRGGAVGTAGIGGMTGLAGRGGSTGVAGSGPAGTLGTAGSSPVGAAGRGGTVGTAGNLGTGGTVTCICADPNRVCDLSGACVCAQSPPQACLTAGIQCGNTTNNCGEPVFCDCLLANAFCELTTGRCLTTCVSGTGGPITTDEAKIICPDQPASQ